MSGRIPPFLLAYCRLVHGITNILPKSFVTGEQHLHHRPSGTMFPFATLTLPCLTHLRKGRRDVFQGPILHFNSKVSHYLGLGTRVRGSGGRRRILEFSSTIWKLSTSIIGTHYYSWYTCKGSWTRDRATLCGAGCPASRPSLYCVP